MIEALITPVVEKKHDKTVEVEVRFDDECLEFWLNGTLLFSGDWDGNFKELFKRALELWE